MKFEIWTDEAARRQRVWAYGVFVLGLQHEPVRYKQVWKKTWKVKSR